MCDVCPDPISVYFFFLGASAVVSILVFIFTRNLKLSLLWLSVLANIFSITDGRSVFRVYDILWLAYLVVFVWPILNIIFIILYVRRKKDKQD